MQLLPVLTIVVPLVGAGWTLGISPLARVRPYTRYIALAATGVTSILILASGWVASTVIAPSLWQPSVLFGTTPALRIDSSTQPLALALAVVTFSALLVGLSRGEEPHPRLLAALQALVAAGVLTLWAANLLTMLISWAIYDVLQAAGHLASGRSTRAAVRSLVFGSLATLLLWGGAVLSGDGVGGELWSLMTLRGPQMTLWTAAGILRLGAYPFHLAAPENTGSASSLAVPLSLGPIMGWGLWLRLASANGGPVPGGTWVPILGAVNLAVGGFMAWCCEQPQRRIARAGLGVAGAILLAAGLAGENAVGVIASGSVVWTLGLGIVSLGDGLHRKAPWWSIPGLVGAAALLGLPLTLGFVTEANLLGGLARAGRLGWGGAFFLGNLFLVPSLARWLLTEPSFPPADRRWLAVVRGIGLGAPLLLLIVAGFHPPLLLGDLSAPSQGELFELPDLVGWLLWAVSLAGGGVLAWQDAALCSKIGLWLSAAHDLLSLEWLYGVVMGALDRGFSVLRAADEVVRGGGALLWSWFLFLLLLLVWGSR